MRRYYVLFFIGHASRRVWLGGCTKNPTGAWVTQQARNLGLDFSDRGVSFLIRDSTYSGPFDEVFRGARAFRDWASTTAAVLRGGQRRRRWRPRR